MFVRWTRRLTNPKKAERHPWLTKHSLYAYIVRSERIDGKPRQRIVRYLAHIGEQYTTETAHQQFFWGRADSQLDDLGLDDPTRQKIEVALLAIVPRPSDSDLDRLERERRALARAPLPR